MRDKELPHQIIRGNIFRRLTDERHDRALPRPRVPAPFDLDVHNIATANLCGIIESLHLRSIICDVWELRDFRRGFASIDFTPHLD